jgi:DeoR family transcriptional regulator of aga operon
MSRGMRYRSAPERRARLLQILEQQGFCSTAELMVKLGISDMTVRRDAQKLAEDGRVRIVHGGVSLIPSVDLQSGREYGERAELMAPAKVALGRNAATQVTGDMVIAIDAGTTGRELARALAPDSDLTVVTNSATVVAELMTHSSTTLVVLGGLLHHETLSFAGPLVLQAISDLQLDVFFLTASGIGPRGVFCANDFDAASKRALISVAARVVLIVDSSKFHAPALVLVCSFDLVDGVIVDDGISEEDLAMLIESGVYVTVIPV